MNHIRMPDEEFNEDMPGAIHLDDEHFIHSDNAEMDDHSLHL